MDDISPDAAEINSAEFFSDYSRHQTSHSDTPIQAVQVALLPNFN